MKATNETIADHFDSASILFADIVDFTPLAQRLSPAEVVSVLDRLFSHFDTLVERHGLEKIKTIGDCYMAAAGVPEPCPDHARRAALLALDMQAAIHLDRGDGVGLELRIGINSGPVIAGVIGRSASCTTSGGTPSIRRVGWSPRAHRERSRSPARRTSC